MTGASRGIGAAIARALAADGWAVGVNYRFDEHGAEAVVTAIESDGGRALALGADVADPATAEKLFGALEEHYGCPVLALVNNAGITADDLTPSLSDEAWDSVIDTDLSAAFRLTRRALKPMLRARAGRIVNVASFSGLRANAGQANYAAAKAGLIALTQDVGGRGRAARDHDQRRCPGRDRDRHDRERSTANYSRMSPRAVLGTPEEVAACVRFLISDEASYVTGAVLTVDGGLAA